jgi:hypothetical protein
MDKVRINKSMRTDAIKPLNPNIRPEPRTSGVRVQPWGNWAFNPEEIWKGIFPKPREGCGWCPSSRG